MKRLRLWFWWIWNGRDRLDMAWTRIEGLERQNSKLAAACLEQHSQLTARVIELENQIAAIRQVATNREPQPAPRKARTWREVQDFTQGETIDVAR